ncbi:2,3-bisphosphoglycerate-independent phosphoglycerate mutase [Candidatus Woesearchaeota archaeon]|nr:2,3-bisphosphoglycerate-independent phosphoglycerate mutase [Candidatus Woesearchaeota archaeon]
MKKNLLFIVIDGCGDVRSGKFEKTPLENEKLKSLNFLAKNGINGIVYVTPGIAPESNSAVLSLLGYHPDSHGGRGPLEAVGTGIDFKKGMLGLRSNFASAEGNNIIDRRVGRNLTSKEAEGFAKAINKKVRLSKGKFVFKPSLAHRAVLIFKAKQKLSANISNTDPAYRMRHGIAEALREFPKIVMESKPLEKGAELSAELLNEFTKKSYEILDSHPINKKREKEGKLKGNIILSRDPGNELPKLHSISKKYGKKWAILADMPLEIGIGKLCGMDSIKLSLPAYTKNDYPERVNKTISAMKKYECLYIHLKGPDLFAHDGDFDGKKKSIEDIDRCYFGPLLRKIDLKNVLILVTADHSTPCINKAHSADPVPILIAGGSIKPDNVEKFNEYDCSKGSLGTLKGLEVMPKIMAIFDKLKKG